LIAISASKLIFIIRGNFYFHLLYSLSSFTKPKICLIEENVSRIKAAFSPEVELKDISFRLKPDFNAVRLSEKKEIIITIKIIKRNWFSIKI